MAKKVTAEIKKEEVKVNYKEAKQMKFLEKLGFVQMVFDFYKAPVT